jgi:hypothetical protein
MHQNNQFGLIDDFSHSTNLGWYNGACTEGLNQATLTPQKKFIEKHDLLEFTRVFFINIFFNFNL